MYRSSGDARFNLFLYFYGLRFECFQPMGLIHQMLAHNRERFSFFCSTINIVAFPIMEYTKLITELSEGRLKK